MTISAENENEVSAPVEASGAGASVAPAPVSPQVYYASSDMYQLLSNFLFLTTPELIAAVADGSLAQDVDSILFDLGVSPKDRRPLVEPFEGLRISSSADSEPAADAAEPTPEADSEPATAALVASASESEPASATDSEPEPKWKKAVAPAFPDEARNHLFHQVRRDYTHLFYNPKISVMTPFQARFLKEETDLMEPRGAIPKGTSRLFAAAGFASARAPKERTDHMGVQLEFMQAIRFSQGAVLESGEESSFQAAYRTAADFTTRYFRRWDQDFFKAVEENALTDLYRAVGRLGAWFTAWDSGLD
ncbi:MAG: molecular chaperone TorD family protein [Eggerthellales bacterium]|nr:molecular chaperone TorD family protein [Eggerthellales bacterium]